LTQQPRVKCRAEQVDFSMAALVLWSLLMPTTTVSTIAMTLAQIQHQAARVVVSKRLHNQMYISKHQAASSKLWAQLAERWAFSLLQ
jgi:hypothetical protein